MLRKEIIKPQQAQPTRLDGEKPIPDIATVQVTSESETNPIDYAFDTSRGPGGTRWIAGVPGEQQIILVFDSPQLIHKILLEIEEPEVSRTQELAVSVSHDGGVTYRELVRQEFNFSPSGTSFERETWTVSAEAVTHFRLLIKPDKGNKPCRATLTSLVLQ